MPFDPPLQTAPPPRPARDPRHRRLDREAIIDMLALEGWAVDLAAGRVAVARDGAARALDIALAAGAGFAEPASGVRLFDPVEIQDALDWAGETGFDGFWTTAKAAANDAFADETRAFADLSDQEEGAPRARFLVSLARTFDLRRLAPSAPARLRMPLPLQSPYHPRPRVTPVVPPELAAAVAVSDGRLEARLPVPAGREITIAAEIDLTANLPAPDPAAGVLAARERELYLRPAEGLIEVTDAVRAAAARLAGDLDPIAAVAAFSAFLIGEFSFHTMRYEELDGEAPVDWALRERAYDCLVCAALLAALCRARGIPARVVNGHYLSRLAPTNHGWTEIWLDHSGWAPVDILHRDRYRPDASDSLDWPADFSRRRDFRLLTECLPLAFTGPTGVRFPPAWQMLHTAAPGGLDITYSDIADGSLIRRDRIRIEPAADAAPAES